VTLDEGKTIRSLLEDSSSSSLGFSAICFCHFLPSLEASLHDTSLPTQIIPFFWSYEQLFLLQLLIQLNYTPFVSIRKLVLFCSHFLTKVVGVINVSVLCINITKLSFFICVLNFTFQILRQVNSIN